MRAWVPRWMRSLLKIRARDAGRFALNQAWLGLDPKGPPKTTTLIVTNGRMAVVARSQDPDGAAETSGGAVVEAEALDEALRLLPRHPSHRSGNHTHVRIEDDVAYIPRYAQRQITFEMEPIEGKYPGGADQLVRDAKERGGASVVLSIKLLKRLVDAVNASVKRGKVRITVPIPDPNEEPPKHRPVLLEFRGEYTGALGDGSPKIDAILAPMAPDHFDD